MPKLGLLIVCLLSLFLLACGGGRGASGGQIMAPALDLDLVVEGNSNNDASNGTSNALSSDQPNILLIIADDQGLDASAQYALSADLPVTPTLNQLASQGIVLIMPGQHRPVPQHAVR